MNEKEVLKKYAPKIRTLVLKYPEYMHEDLMQEAYFGLILAVRRFDPKINKQFNTYAWCYILGYVKHAVRIKFNTIRTPMRTEKQIKRFGEAIPYTYKSIEKITTQEDNETNRDYKYNAYLAVEASEFDDEIDYIKKILTNYDNLFMAKNATRDKHILIERLTKGRTLESIAQELNITKERVRHICLSGTKNIKKLATKKGIKCS